MINKRIASAKKNDFGEVARKKHKTATESIQQFIRNRLVECVLGGRYS